MNQPQTNSLLIFLTTILVFYGAYPIIMGGYNNHDTFTALVLIIAAALIAIIYYLISEQKSHETRENEFCKQKPELTITTALTQILVFIVLIIITFFLGHCAFPGQEQTVMIGTFSGFMSGGMVLFYERFYLGK